MPRRMSCSITVDAVRARTKTVTRRSVDTWKDLKEGDRLVLVEKGMGLKKGERQVVLAEVEVVDVTVEPLHLVDEYECEAEGFPEMTPSDFIDMWLESHGDPKFETQTDFMKFAVRRIQWRYLDPPIDTAPTGTTGTPAVASSNWPESADRPASP